MNVLVLFHTRVNTGYAMAPLEKTFFEVASELAGNQGDVHFAFSKYDGEQASSLPENFENVFEISREKLLTTEGFKSALNEILPLRLDLAFCFDLQVDGPVVKLLRAAKVKTVVSYWGATMSSKNKGLKLLAKKLEVALSFRKPNLFIFESEAMRYFAVNGRGIRYCNTTVIPTGVDESKFSPSKKDKESLCNEFGIPKINKIAIYSGHMEQRKGVEVIIRAVMSLYDNHGCDGWSFLICGNQPGEEKIFLDILSNHPASANVIFCGYRSDIDRLMASSDVGIIASTGWDSFPMSALEMAASGLPIIVSNLQGLAETVESNVTGLMFTPGDYESLADILVKMQDKNFPLESMSVQARKRIIDGYTIPHQKTRLLDALRRI